MAAVCNVSNFAKSTMLLATTTLRTVLGTKTLAEILSEREAIAAHLIEILDDATDPWGVKVERVEVKDVRLLMQLQRAMQLRYLQTLNTIAAEKNSTIIFPLPIELLSNFGK